MTVVADRQQTGFVNGIRPYEPFAVLIALGCCRPEPEVRSERSNIANRG
jgi:hypothetical protein